MTNARAKLKNKNVAVKPVLKSKKSEPKQAFTTKSKSLIELIDYHSYSEADDSAISMICNFKPEELNQNQATKLLEMGEKLKQIYQLVPVNSFEAIKLWSLIDWIDCKRNDYLRRFDKTINAFKRIYKALYDGETRLFKTNFLTTREKYTPQELMRDIELFPTPRTKEALRLAKQFSNQCNWDNDALFTAIYKYSFRHSLVKRSCMMGVSFFRTTSIDKHSVIKLKTDFIDKHPTSRSAKISTALGYQKR